MNCSTTVSIDVSVSKRNHGQSGPRRLRLTSCVFAALGLGGFAMSSIASTISVSHCDDRVSKTGNSLRQAIAHANDGDTVDLSALPSDCSVITLTGGEIRRSADQIQHGEQ
jgi:hypothetical protein